jgi:hypothetical protein
MMQRNLASALESQIANALTEADFKLYGLQQRAIATANARATNPTDIVRALFNESFFAQNTGGDIEVRQKGVVKYGRKGEWLLHVGVDEEVCHMSFEQRVCRRKWTGR